MRGINLRSGLDKDRAEMVKHFCSMKWEQKDFSIVKKKNCSDWSVYVSGKFGFDKNINEVKEFVNELINDNASSVK